ncbi:MAG: trypsin-like peptidase domain-containing protein [Ignavibacteriales bacterium]|nr:trypsin-like peptidase domain-containing protein [Ignavibacteriales bacterium]
MGKYSFGTGFVVNGDLIITNHHVVKNATGLIIYDSAKEENSFIAYPVWSDSVLDLAILRTVDKLTLPSLTLANQWDLKLGEDILVIGFPGETYK